MSGGTVTDHKIFHGSVYIDVIDGDGVSCAIYVERCRESESISKGDSVWWQGDYARWTAKGSLKEHIKIKRIGFSGVPYPHDRPVLQAKYID